jgi:putative ABC transport system ATP-binding protein
VIGRTAVFAMSRVVRRFDSHGSSVPVLRGVDLAVRRGEFVAITGPSGSGKSTLLHLAALLDAPDEGSLVFDGQDTAKLTDAQLCRLRGRAVGMVFQRFCLLPHRTVRQNVAFRYRYVDDDDAGADTASRVERVLVALDLSHVADRPVRLLSGGEMQRVAIARAVAMEPSLLIADEPTGNLDRSAAQSVMQAFRQLNERGLTILMVTHNEGLLQYCSRRLRLEDGYLTT